MQRYFGIMLETCSHVLTQGVKTAIYTGETVEVLETAWASSCFFIIIIFKLGVIPTLKIPTKS